MSGELKLVKLQVNAAGGWRDIMTFDVAQDAEVMDLAPRLFSLAQYGDKFKLRVIIPGDTAPLVDWNLTQGWLAWGEKMAARGVRVAA